MRLLLFLSRLFLISLVYSRALPDVANSDLTLLQGVTANAPNLCGGPTRQRSSSATDQKDLQTHAKRADLDTTPSEDSCPAIITNPRTTKKGKMACPDGFFVYHLCCRGPTEETGGLYPNIQNCRFSNSNCSSLHLCRNSVLSFSLGGKLPCLFLSRDYCCQGVEVGFSFLVFFFPGHHLSFIMGAKRIPR